jgi:hypothetical protein
LPAASQVARADTSGNPAWRVQPRENRATSTPLAARNARHRSSLVALE